MCGTGGKVGDATFANTVALTKLLMSKYGISASNVVRHYDVCSKSCPGWSGWLGSNPTLWNKFKSDIGVSGSTSAGSTTSGTGSSTTASSTTTSASYYKAFSSSSITDGLKSIGVDSSMANRTKIASANGVSNYTGTASQNISLLNLAKAGKLKVAGSASSGGTTTASASYYKAFSSSSIVDGFKSIGVDSSMSTRKKIATANGISNYTGTASQNTTLLSLAKQGKLKKA